MKILPWAKNDSCLLSTGMSPEFCILRTSSLRLSFTRISPKLFSYCCWNLSSFLIHVLPHDGYNGVPALALLCLVISIVLLTVGQLSISLSLANMHLQGISPTSPQSWTFPWANVFSNIWKFSFICHMGNWHLTGQNLGLLYSLPALILTFYYLSTKGISIHWKHGCLSSFLLALLSIPFDGQV